MLGRCPPICSIEENGAKRAAWKLEQNAEVRRALDATRGLRLTHELLDENGAPVPDSITLPSAVFCAIWTRLRDEVA